MMNANSFKLFKLAVNKDVEEAEQAITDCKPKEVCKALIDLQTTVEAYRHQLDVTGEAQAVLSYTRTVMREALNADGHVSRRHKVQEHFSRLKRSANLMLNSQCIDRDDGGPADLVSVGHVEGI